MSWVGLLAAVIVTLLMQTTVCRMGDLPLIALDLMLVLALVYGLLAPVHDARLAGWIIGLATDLMTDGPIGIYALALGLTALLATQLRETMNRRLWWVRLLIGLLAAVPGQVLVVLHLRFIQGAQGGAWGEMLWSAVVLSAAAALVAALITSLPQLVPRHRTTSRIVRGRL